MKLEFVNHASFIARHGDVSLISDPWLEGTAFDDGWGLLSATALPYDAFEQITHLWFSHEHPDHFSPPCIKKIPEAHRRKISVYFQETGDRKVIDYCRKMNFKEVIEMPRRQWLEVGPGFEFMCCNWPGFEDSWSVIRTPTATILNLNDCTINTAEEIQQVKDIVGPIDVLLTQFSISAWDGNALERDRRLQGAQTMLDRTVLQTNLLEASYVIPFASYIWFCHEENFYMNEAFLSIDDVAASLRERTQAEVLVMYPGDDWTVGQPYDSQPALAKYRRDLDGVPLRERVKAPSVPESKLFEQSVAYCKKVNANAHRSKLRMHLARKLPDWRRRRRGADWTAREQASAMIAALTLRCEPARIFVPDLGKSYTFDVFAGLRPSSLPEQECDVAIGSSALLYSFTHLWGGQTLHINGRFRRIAPERGPLFHFYSLAGEQNAGRAVSWKSLPADLGRRLRRRR